LFSVGQARVAHGDVTESTSGSTKEVHIMSEAPTKFARRHKLVLASLATVVLSLGTAGVVSAAASAPTSEEVAGVDCVDGIDAATGAECDGGRAANPQDGAEEGTEAADGVQSKIAGNPSKIATIATMIAGRRQSAAGATEQGTDAAGESEDPGDDEAGGVDCENGIDAATGAECDGGPAANPQDGADDGSEESSE